MFQTKYCPIGSSNIKFLKVMYDDFQQFLRTKLDIFNDIKMFYNNYIFGWLI